MNLVLDEAEEVHIKNKTRKTLGMKTFYSNDKVKKYEIETFMYTQVHTL